MKIAEFDVVISWVKKGSKREWVMRKRERQRGWPENEKRWGVDGGDRERERERGDE